MGKKKENSKMLNKLLSAQLLFGPQASLLATVRKNKKGVRMHLLRLEMHTINVQEKDLSAFFFCFFLFSGDTQDFT